MVLVLHPGWLFLTTIALCAVFVQSASLWHAGWPIAWKVPIEAEPHSPGTARSVRSVQREEAGWRVDENDRRTDEAPRQTKKSLSRASSYGSRNCFFSPINCMIPQDVTSYKKLTGSRALRDGENIWASV